MAATVDALEPRRAFQLLAVFALVVAFAAASWGRLALPFSTGEAAFVHAALRASGQAMPPDFPGAPQAPQARTLAVVQQLVGPGERALRIACLLMLAISGWVLAELILAPSLATAITPLLFLLASPDVTRADFLRPETFAVLPATLALLAAPIGGFVSAARALLGLGGALAAGAFSFHGGAAAALPLLAIAAARGSALERLTALVTGAAGIAMAWVVHGPPSSAPGLPWSAEARLIAFSLAPAATLVLSNAARAGGPILAGLVPFLLAVAIGFGLRASIEPTRGVAKDVLAQARGVASTDGGLAVAGPDRVAVAVYARLGHAPPMPLFFVPENADPDALARLCRRYGVRRLWFHRPPVNAPRGLASAESRPAHVPLLAPFLVDAR
jgi:hypothetical protein